MDKQDLKIEALRQRIAEITAQYEDRIADLRVELTVLSQELEGFKKESDNVEMAESADTSS